MADPLQLVVGLGNPGPAYRDTRHNVGQAVVERLAARLGCRFRRDGPALVAAATWDHHSLRLAQPQAFMNAIGPPVAQLLARFGLGPEALIVVHDDLDLPFGRVRVRMKGRHGGHNGVRSLIETLGTEAFRRVKVGIGRPVSRDEVVDWVLAPWSPEERARLPEVLDHAAERVLALAAAWTGRGGHAIN